MVPIRSPLALVHVMLGRGTPRAWQMISVPAIKMIIFFILGSFPLVLFPENVLQISIFGCLDCDNYAANL